MAQFTHLHVHSHYSLLDGLIKIDDLVAKTKELGMDAIALTDHGAIYGAVEFFQKAKKAGIKPIIGCEMYVASGSASDKNPGPNNKRFHLTLLVKNKVGYQNLVRLITKAHLDGFYYKPRVDKNLLRQYSEGLICLSGCRQAEIPHLINSDQIEKAESVAKEYQEIFGPDNFYMEIQPHFARSENKELYQNTISLAQKLRMPLVATNDSHYLNKEDEDYHDVLLAVGTGNKISDPNRLSLKGFDLSLKSAEEMAGFFKELPEAIENTEKIASAIDFEFEFGNIQFPHFELPAQETAENYLEKLATEGLNKRFGYGSLGEAPKELADRFKFELGIIQRTGFASYILIVWDIVNWAKSQGIAVGPGRGSAAGSLISYLIGITNIDPIKYTLLFERFLNPDRIAPPDIDLDFADHRRNEILDYISQKYGREHVAQIITFGTMAARAAIRDAGRALGFSYGFCDKIAKMVPFNTQGSDNKKSPLEKAVENISELKQAVDTDPQARQLIQTAKKLEGVARHASTHACGVVITKNPTIEYMPLQWAIKSGGKKGEEQALVTQYEMRSVENLGLLKMDILGLRNLTIIEKALRLIEKNYGEKIDIYNIPLDDEKTFDILRRADTVGVFQVESPGMRRYLKEIKPTELEDLIVLVALFRPGPMELIPNYIARKHGKEKVSYLHPKLEPILKNTYGIAVYQEQLMQIANQLAGFTLAEADILRKAVGKKIKKLLDEQSEKLISGMVNNGISKPIAEKIWQYVEPFARYGFNRCLTGDVQIQNSQSGAVHTINKLYKNKNLIKKTYSLNSKNKIVENKIVDIISNGVKPVFEIKTRSGRRIKVTTNHPFLTPFGWQILKNIKIGERIATPRITPEPIRPLAMPFHKTATLGYLLAEGNFCHPNGFYFYSKSEEEVGDYTANLEKFNNTVGKKDFSKSTIAVYSKRANVKYPSEAVQWIDSLKLKNKSATKKFFPDLVFCLSNNDLAVLMAKMFQGDGCINMKRKDPQIFYATSSIKIAEGLQQLFLRFGIISAIHYKKFKYRDGLKTGYTISVSRYDNIAKFIKCLSPYFVGQKKAVCQKILKSHPIINKEIKNWSARGSKDIIPSVLAFPLIRQAIFFNQISYSQAALQYGFAERLLFQNKKKVGFLRETIHYLSEKLRHQPLKELSESDIYWDEVISIKPKGQEITYDIEMARDHNFVANNIFVHNSHAACYALIAYQTAYLKANFPAEFMTALLNAESFDLDRVAVLMSEAKKIGINILPPDINESLKDFTLIKDADKTKIRFGLSAIKNLSANTVESAIARRQQSGLFADLQNFLERIPLQDLNKKSLEALIKCGAMDSFAERQFLLSNIEEVQRYARDTNKNNNSPQTGLFNSYSTLAPLKLVPAEPAEKKEKLVWEKEYLGLYTSEHPTQEYREMMEKKSLLIQKINPAMAGQNVAIGGLISGIQKFVTKNGKLMLFTKLEDWANKIEVVVFPDMLERTPEIWVEEKIVIIQGKVSERNGTLSIICDAAQELKL